MNAGGKPSKRCGSIGKDTTPSNQDYEGFVKTHILHIKAKANKTFLKTIVKIPPYTAI